MGKSIRCKTKKRLHTAKRQRLDAMVVRPGIIEHHDNLKKIIETGKSVTLKTPKNAFKYPEADGACFPQNEIMKPIDYRAQSLPMAGYVFRGGRRKYNPEEKDYMYNLSKVGHPKLESLAGGGAILAKTGERISTKESEILATQACDPAAADFARQTPTVSAVDRMAKFETETHQKLNDYTNQPHPNQEPSQPIESDHKRVPIVKDNRRAARTGVDKKARSKKSKKSIVK